MTAPDHTDTHDVMTRSLFPMRALILAAYLLAAILPMLAFADGRQQSQADHEQMMAMAGHVAQLLREARNVLMALIDDEALFRDDGQRALRDDVSELESVEDRILATGHAT